MMKGKKSSDKLTVRQNSTRCLEARKHFVASLMICITSGAKKIAVLKLASTSIKSGTIRRIGGRGQILYFRLSCFLFFVLPAQALLNSTPQLLARQRRAVAQGAQL